MLVTKASQEIWDDYLNGEITGYSMYGIARQSIAKTEPETPDVGWIQKMMEKAGIIKGFQETLDSEIERIKTSPTFIMSMMEQEFWKNIDWGTESNEQLTALAESMEGAIKYIRETIEESNDDTEESVSKNDDGTVEETADESKPIIDENIVVEKTDDATATSDDNESQHKEQDLVLDIEKINAEINQLKEENEKLLKENEEIVKSLEEKNEEIEKLMVRSNFQTTIQDNLAPAEPKPRLF
jgi:predicted RNase H-like nuclease (RuvC/YqgF family)